MAVFLAVCVIVIAWRGIRVKPAESQAGAPGVRTRADRMQSEATVDAMMAELRGPLRQSGQLAALEKPAQKSLDYFVAQNLHELSEADLLRHVKALINIGDFWIESACYPEAKRALHAAHERTSVLTAHGLGDAEVKLLCGRIEAAMALILRRQGEPAASRVWSGRHRSTMESMFGRNDANAPWQQDLLQRQHELAEKALAQRQPAATRERQLDELAARSRVPLETPAALDRTSRPRVRPDERSTTTDR